MKAAEDTSRVLPWSRRAGTHKRQIELEYTPCGSLEVRASCRAFSKAAPYTLENHMAVEIQEHEPLARHTVFKIGGPARFFITTEGCEDLITVLRAARASNVQWAVLGAGSNVLASDRGFPGMIIRPTGGTVKVAGEDIRVDASVPMARAVAESLACGLRGFEWAIGVPGTIGGSVRGNAGCFGREMRDVVRAVSVVNTATGATEEWSADALEFGYRESILKRRPELVVLAVTLGLTAGDSAEGQRLVREYTAHRGKTQDIGSPSAGCIFKNILWARRDVNKERLVGRFPEFAPFRDHPAIPAGFLIDQLGLKGQTIGGAKVSERHGNFFLNTGRATAEEVVMLIGLAKERVHRRYGLLLEEEIQYIGF